MGAAEMTTRVQCRCGEAEIELTGEPLVQFYCHCEIAKPSTERPMSLNRFIRPTR